MNKNITLGLALVAVVIATVALLKEPQVQPIEVGANPGPVTMIGQEHLGGTVFGKVSATSSSVATYTLTANDIASEGYLFDTISFAKTGAVATTTWTLPATSTLRHVLPGRGQRARMCLAVATSSPASPGLTIAAGTGWDIETSSTTPTGLTINGGSYGCLDIIRRSDTDLGAALTIFKDAD